MVTGLFKAMTWLPTENSARDFGRGFWKIPWLMKIMISICAFALSLGVTTAVAADTNKSEAKPAPKAADQKEVAVIKTSEGEMIVEFWPDVAPKTVENFKTLAKKGFYDGTCFHRVIKGFMIQGGDPLTKDASKEDMWGTGDPGYKIKAEFNDHSHTRGVLSMARSQDPNSAGSQFFICHGNPTFLDHQYTTFGKLIKGDDVLEKIATTPTHPPDRPDKRMNIESIKIVPADSVK
jgi:peptidyl-prolyl cis-trans isomerase B (cyclophilin B)